MPQRPDFIGYNYVTNNFPERGAESLDDRAKALLAEAKTPEQLDAIRKILLGVQVPRVGDGLPAEVKPIEGGAYWCEACDIELNDLTVAIRHANSPEHATAAAAFRAA